MRLVGDCRKHGADQYGIGGQGHIFLCAGADRVHGAARIGSDAACDHGRADPFVRERADEETDVEHDIGHDEIGAAPLSQVSERQFDGARMRHFGALLDGDLGCRADLPAETAHN